jgi:hypothetical protein
LKNSKVGKGCDLSVPKLAFANNNKLLIIYLPGSKRETQAYVGSYDLETKELYRLSLKFPWSLSGYYIAYSAHRSEVYTIGSNGIFILLILILIL